MKTKFELLNKENNEIRSQNDLLQKECNGVKKQNELLEKENNESKTKNALLLKKYEVFEKKCDKSQKLYTFKWLINDLSVLKNIYSEKFCSSTIPYTFQLVVWYFPGIECVKTDSLTIKLVRHRLNDNMNAKCVVDKHFKYEIYIYVKNTTRYYGWSGNSKEKGFTIDVESEQCSSEIAMASPFIGRYVDFPLNKK